MIMAGVKSLGQIPPPPPQHLQVVDVASAWLLVSSVSLVVFVV